MAVLSGGGGGWYEWNKQAPGTTMTGTFVSFAMDVPGKFGKRDILQLEVNGDVLNMQCPAQLGSVFKKNNVEPGTLLAITYNGKKSIKGGKTAHDFRVETVEGDTSFPPKADVPADDAAALQAKLDALKAKKDKRAA